MQELPPQLDPVVEAELIKEGARINPMTGRLPEHANDPMCDHCGEDPWTVLILFNTLVEEFHNWSRRLCGTCTKEVLGWV